MKTNWLKECIESYDDVREYSSNGIKICLSNSKTSFPKVQHTGEDYEFLVVRNKETITYNKIKDMVIKKGHILPFASRDVKGELGPVTVNGYLYMVVDSELVRRVAEEAFGFTEKLTFNSVAFRPTSMLNNYLSDFIDEVELGETEASYVLKKLSELIVLELLRTSDNNMCQKEVRGASFVLKGKKYLDENYKSAFNLDAAAKVAGLNKSNFKRLFSKRIGITPKQYHLKTRIEKAKSLILMGEMSLSDIATELGYSSQSHFSMHFKRVTGMTPRDFKMSASY